MAVETITVGTMETNCYILGCDISRNAAIIDPGGDYEKIVAAVQRQGLQVRFILNTHGHIDHILANEQIREHYNCPVYIHQQDAVCLRDNKLNLSNMLLPQPPEFSEPDRELQEGDTLQLGKLDLTILHTPGHSPGSISILVDKQVFTGDALFCQGIGRTDLPGGDTGILLESIREKLFSLPDEFIIRPGHGPGSTIGLEKEQNPFVHA